MPIDPHELLHLARDLVDRNPGSQIEGDLRRAISTAYYAVFHLLINEATSIIVMDATFRPRVGRAFQHGLMKSICEQYSPKNPDKATGDYVTISGVLLTPEVRHVAGAFRALHEAREEADYDGAVTIQHTNAATIVQQAEDAFKALLTAQTQPTATLFLQDLFCKCAIRK